MLSQPLGEGKRKAAGEGFAMCAQIDSRAHLRRDAAIEIFARRSLLITIFLRIRLVQYTSAF